MQPSNTIVQGSASLRQVFAVAGILVALAIIVPILGIITMPVAALGAGARALVDAAAELRAGWHDRAAARSTPASRRHPATRMLGASDPCASEMST